MLTDEQEKQERQDKIVLEIVDCAKAVYSSLGHGFQEIVYHRALSAEMMLRGIEHRREYKLPLYYKCIDIGAKRIDFLVEGEMPVEAMAFINLSDTHIDQALRNLVAYNLETGVLINFGAEHLQLKRLFNKKYREKY